MRDSDIDSLSADGAQAIPQQRTAPRTAPRTAVGRFPCGECGQTVAPREWHTFLHCTLHKAGVNPADYGIRLVAEAAEQSGPLDVDALRRVIYGLLDNDRYYLEYARDVARLSKDAAAEYARLIPQPAQPAKPVCEHTSIGKRTINGPDGRMAGVESFCVACGKVNPLAQPAQPADMALDVVEDVIMSEPAWPRSGAVRRRTIMEKIRTALASQSSASEPDHG